MSRAPARPFVIGVTGGIATGKSAVLAVLGELGAEPIDADAVYHELIAPGLPLWRHLRDRFGEEIITPRGTIDRRKLGDIVFADASALVDLDALTHPAVVAEIKERLARAASPVVAIDAVKLIESGLADICDRVWLVTCDRDVQRTRLMSRNNLTPDEAERRLVAQPSVSAQAERADLIIDNSGDLSSTQELVQRAWDALPVASQPGG
ncbi:MAG TPA: dephospho-CoA kinase [Thermomicrobiales bacterium]|nr:dephospho-CoA kinase [Thermomicrobiales bacterium]